MRSNHFRQSRSNGSLQGSLKLAAKGVEIDGNMYRMLIHLRRKVIIWFPPITHSHHNLGNKFNRFLGKANCISSRTEWYTGSF